MEYFSHFSVYQCVMKCDNVIYLSVCSLYFGDIHSVQICINVVNVSCFLARYHQFARII